MTCLCRSYIGLPACAKLYRGETMTACRRQFGVPSLCVWWLCLALIGGWFFASPAFAQIGAINWFPIGPADILNGQTYSGRNHVSGRATAIAVNPVNPNDIWLGT